MTPSIAKTATSSPTKSPGKARKKKSLQSEAIEHRPKIVLVNASRSQEQDKKASYENLEEAKTLATYLDSFHNFLDMDSVAIMSPIRSQVLLVKNYIQDVKKDQLHEDVSGLTTFGSFEDFVSRTFNTIIVSVCKTEDFENKGGPLLNDKRVVDFLLSRLAPPKENEERKLVVIGRSDSFNQLWKESFVQAPGVERMEF